MATQRYKLTKKLIDSVQPNGSVQRIWDSECPGFFLKVVTGPH